MSYNAGELVYMPGNTVARVYLSLTNNNADEPVAVAPAFDLTVSYNPGDFVLQSNVAYKSIWPAGTNVGNSPISSPNYWESTPTFDVGISYVSGAVVMFAEALYISLSAANLGHQPDAGAPWRLYQPDLALGNWLLLDASLAQIINPAPLYPGMGVFPKPCGYLRTAPQNPKDGSYSLMGAPTNAAYKDWLYEGPWIISGDGSMMSAFRFVADVADTTQFDPMFFEGLAARIAKEVCEELTQSGDKLDRITRAYTTAMGEARLVNGIEVGSEEAPMDDYLTTRY